MYIYFVCLFVFPPTAKPAEEKPRSRESGEGGVPTRVGGSPPRTSAVQTCLAELSMEIEGDFSPCKNVRQERPSGVAHPNENQPPDVVMQRNEEDSTEFSHHSRFFDEDLQAAVDFFKLPPPLLSPVPSPPLGSLPHLGTLPSSLAPVSLYFEFELPNGHSFHPIMLAILREHLWYSD